MFEDFLVDFAVRQSLGSFIEFKWCWEQLKNIHSSDLALPASLTLRSLVYLSRKVG